MKTKLTHLTLVALLTAAGTTTALAHVDYSEAGTQHWLSHVAESTGQPATVARTETPATPVASNIQAVPLKSGLTLHIFPDGKMAMEDRFGRSVRMSQGMVMETLDGRKIKMYGDETARLDSLLNKYNLGA